jgi:trk system potassium uptake protein TrkA
MNIVLVGIGKVGYYLVKTLIERKHSISVVEKEPLRCTLVAEEFGVTTICGDGTVLARLSDAGADRANALLAVTGQDEVNLLCAQLAKRKLGVPRSVARCNNPRNRDLFQQLGIDFIVSSTALIADVIEREITAERVRTLLNFHYGDLGLVEMSIPWGVPATRNAVASLARSFPEGCVLVSVIRGDQVILPRGDTQLHAGDTVMALAHTGVAEPLRRVLLGEE